MVGIMPMSLLILVFVHCPVYFVGTYLQRSQSNELMIEWGYVQNMEEFHLQLLTLAFFLGHTLYMKDLNLTEVMIGKSISQKQQEDFQTLLTYSSDGLLVTEPVDSDETGLGKLMFVNRRFTDCFDLEPDDPNIE